MRRHHQKSPFIFFSIILIVSFTVVAYIYFDNYATSLDVTWEEASLKVSTNWGACPPTFPCYETYLLNSDGIILHNEEVEGRLSQGKMKEVVKKAFNFYKNNLCTPIYDSNVSENYELKIDEKIYQFGGDGGCKEMQIIIDTLKKSIII